MAAAILTHARLRELLDYNAETGVFTWRVSRQGHCKAGSAAGARRHDGYIRICVDQRRVWGHRLAWFYVHGEWPSQQIDHINGNPSDNRTVGSLLKKGCIEQYEDDNRDPDPNNKLQRAQAVYCAFLHEADAPMRKGVGEVSLKWAAKVLRAAGWTVIPPPGTGTPDRAPSFADIAGD